MSTTMAAVIGQSRLKTLSQLSAWQQASQLTQTVLWRHSEAHRHGKERALLLRRTIQTLLYEEIRNRLSIRVQGLGQNVPTTTKTWPEGQESTIIATGRASAPKGGAEAKQGMHKGSHEQKISRKGSQADAMRAKIHQVVDQSETIKGLE